MPSFEFACRKCDQRFRVTHARIGLRLKCPACHEVQAVPRPEVAVVQLADRAARKHPPESSEFAIREDRELDAWDECHDGTATLTESEKEANPWKSALRGVLLFAAILTAYLAYQWGYGWGGRHIGPATTGTLSQAVLVSGRVRIEDRADRRRDQDDDPGRSLVVAIPAGHRLDERIPSAVMTRGARQSSEFATAVRSIQVLGGDVTWSRPNGGFVLNLPNSGSYDLLVVMEQRRRSDLVPREDLARVGHLFVPAFDLLADRQYLMIRKSVQTGRELELLVPMR